MRGGAEAEEAVPGTLSTDVEALQHSQEILCSSQPSVDDIMQQGLVPYQQQNCHDHDLRMLLQRDRLVEQQRQEQEQHHHKQIWTKDPHGGPYKKVAVKDDSCAAAVRRSLQVAGVKQLRPEDLLGYEAVDIGPTTNFVGNHMTKGAIDLVQAELSGMASRTAGRCLPVRHPGDSVVGAASGPRDIRLHMASSACASASEESAGSEGQGSTLPAASNTHQPANLPLRAIHGPGDMAALRLLARQLMLARDQGATAPPVRIMP